MECHREVQQHTHGRGAFRAAGREEVCCDVIERCGVTHMAEGQSGQQGGRRRHAAMLQRGVAVCMLQGVIRADRCLPPTPPE
jgi:hypothetical protein